MSRRPERRSSGPGQGSGTGGLLRVFAQRLTGGGQVRGALADRADGRRSQGSRQAEFLLLLLPYLKCERVRLCECVGVCAHLTVQ